ncbi:hypothetical protein Fmac_029585 [Flemingia macrophylla]|uniref:HTH myb-type domain-containing protein n=1 Tax=Flemingia macrophylla TaxID=520843 RepID=A0ABD1LAX8_9FABA
MREEDSNWFSRWEEELPSPDELMPLSQTLITPDLAIAFDIRNPHTTTNAAAQHHQPPPQQQQPSNPSSLPNPQPTSAEFADSAELGSGTGGEEPARTLKRPRLVWTPQLHKRFVDAVAHLGIKNAVPKTIMQLMSVDGLTRENVASHLQKYRLYLKRMQGISAAGPAVSAADPPPTTSLPAPPSPRISSTPPPAPTPITSSPSSPSRRCTTTSTRSSTSSSPPPLSTTTGRWGISGPPPTGTSTTPSCLGPVFRGWGVVPLCTTTTLFLVMWRTWNLLMLPLEVERPCFARAVYPCVEVEVRENKFQTSKARLPRRHRFTRSKVVFPTSNGDNCTHHA